MLEQPQQTKWDRHALAGIGMHSDIGTWKDIVCKQKRELHKSVWIQVWLSLSLLGRQVWVDNVVAEQRLPQKVTRAQKKKRLVDKKQQRRCMATAQYLRDGTTRHSLPCEPALQAHMRPIGT